MANLNAIRAAKSKHAKELLKKTNVVSVGVGHKLVNGKPTGELAVIVGVSRKMPSVGMRAQDIVPQTLDGVPLDVQDVGVITSAGGKPVAATSEFDPKLRHRPMVPGCSVGHPKITAGTLGMFVKQGSELLVLTNSHVAADSGAAKLGDPLYQPGPHDGGSSADTAGHLKYFAPINFMSGGSPPAPPPGGGTGTCPVAGSIVLTANLIARALGRKHRLMSYSSSELEPNRVDAAIATVEVGGNLEIPRIGVPRGVVEAELGMDLQKTGRTTNYTTGKILQVDVTVQVAYGDSQIAQFEDQIVAGPMSAGGDSGSAVLDMDRRVVGLLFAGSEEVTILSPIGFVFDALNVTLAM